MKWIPVILTLIFLSQSYSQVRHDNQERLYPTLLDKESRVSDDQVEKARSLFQTVEKGIVEGTVDKFSHNFDNQIFVNITKGESGYFSSGQAASLLQHYFGTRKIVSFEFSRMSEKGLTPYATGRLISIYRGSMESAQVYVSCTWQSTKWVIEQFNIY
jgi:hypothetical protein